MNLRDYLASIGMSAEQFAALIGVEVQSVYRYMLGRRFPRPETMDKIERATGGKVTYASMRSARPAVRKVQRFREQAA